jgi:hypothetical protein
VCPLLAAGSLVALFVYAYRLFFREEAQPRS